MPARGRRSRSRPSSRFAARSMESREGGLAALAKVRSDHARGVQHHGSMVAHAIVVHRDMDGDIATPG